MPVTPRHGQRTTRIESDTEEESDENISGERQRQRDRLHACVAAWQRETITRRHLRASEAVAEGHRRELRRVRAQLEEQKKDQGYEEERALLALQNQLHNEREHELQSHLQDRLELEREHQLQLKLQQDQIEDQQAELDTTRWDLQEEKLRGDYISWKITERIRKQMDIDLLRGCLHAWVTTTRNWPTQTLFDEVLAWQFERCRRTLLLQICLLSWHLEATLALADQRARADQAAAEEKQERDFEDDIANLAAIHQKRVFQMRRQMFLSLAHADSEVLLARALLTWRQKAETVQHQREREQSELDEAKAFAMMVQDQQNKREEWRRDLCLRRAMTVEKLFMQRALCAWWCHLQVHAERSAAWQEQVKMKACADSRVERLQEPFAARRKREAQRLHFIAWRQVIQVEVVKRQHASHQDHLRLRSAEQLKAAEAKTEDLTDELEVRRDRALLFSIVVEWRCTVKISHIGRASRQNRESERQQHEKDLNAVLFEHLRVRRKIADGASVLLGSLDNHATAERAFRALSEWRRIEDERRERELVAAQISATRQKHERQRETGLRVMQFFAGLSLRRSMALAFALWSLNARASPASQRYHPGQDTRRRVYEAGYRLGYIRSEELRWTKWICYFRGWLQVVRDAFFVKSITHLRQEKEEEAEAAAKATYHAVMSQFDFVEGMHWRDVVGFLLLLWRTKVEMRQTRQRFRKTQEATRQLAVNSIITEHELFIERLDRTLLKEEIKRQWIVMWVFLFVWRDANRREQNVATIGRLQEMLQHRTYYHQGDLRNLQDKYVTFSENWAEFSNGLLGRCSAAAWLTLAFKGFLWATELEKERQHADEAEAAGWRHAEWIKGALSHARVRALYQAVKVTSAVLELETVRFFSGWHRVHIMERAAKASAKTRQAEEEAENKKSGQEAGHTTASPNGAAGSSRRPAAPSTPSPRVRQDVRVSPEVAARVNLFVGQIGDALRSALRRHAVDALVALITYEPGLRSPQWPWESPQTPLVPGDDASGFESPPGRPVLPIAGQDGVWMFPGADGAAITDTFQPVPAPTFSFSFSDDLPGVRIPEQWDVLWDHDAESSDVTRGRLGA